MQLAPILKVLGLDSMEVRIFKDEVQAVLYITGHYRTFANSFILYNISSMQRHFTRLVHGCLQSVNYNRNIGKALGIEKEAKVNAFEIAEFDFYKGFPN